MARFSAKTMQLMGFEPMPYRRTKSTVKAINDSDELYATLESLRDDIADIIKIEEKLDDRLQDVWSYMLNADDPRIQSIHDYVKKINSEKYLSGDMETVLSAVRAIITQLRNQGVVS